MTSFMIERAVCETVGVSFDVKSVMQRLLTNVRFPLRPELTGRVDGLSTRVVETGLNQ